MTISLAHFESSDLAVIESADEVASLPASNLFSPSPFESWRTSDANAFVVLDYGASYDVSQIVLLYTNARPSATWRIRAAGSAANTTAAPAFDSGVLNHRPASLVSGIWVRNHALLDLGTVVSQRFWRIDITQTGALGYYEAARAYLGDPYRSSRGLDWGDTIVPINTDSRRRSRNGTAHARRGGLYREVELNLATTSTTEILTDIGNIRRRVEGYQPVLYCKSPRATSLGNSAVGSVAMYTDTLWMEHMIYGHLADPVYEDNRQRQVRRVRLRIDEVVHP